MKAFFRRLFSTDVYAVPADKERARIIYGVTAAIGLLFTLYMLFVPGQTQYGTLLQSAPYDGIALISIVVVYGMIVFTMLCVRRGFLMLGAVGPVAMWYFSGVLLAVRDGFVHPDAGAAMLIFIMFGGVLLYEIGLVATSALAIATLVIRFVLGESGRLPGPYIGLADMLPLLLELIGGSAAVFLFLRTASQSERAGRAQAVEERLRLASLNTEIAGRISRRMALDEVLNTAVNSILESYPQIYHAQIFLVDETAGEARLAASTGEVGRLLLARRHSLPVGSVSVIGRVTSADEPVVARAGAADSVHRRNEFLPETRVEAAFPLRIGGRVIGALDLQSKLDDAFPDDDLPVYQSLADSIAVAIDNARLIEETERQLAENQRLLQDMRVAVGEVERLNRQLTERVWAGYLARRRDLSVDYELPDGRAQVAAGWTPVMRSAVEAGRAVVESGEDTLTVAVPLTVRGQVIGALEFELAGTEPLEREDLALVETVAERLSLALENNRLFEQSQAQALRERKANEISSRLMTATDVDALLRVAAEQFNEALGAVHTRVYVEPGILAEPVLPASEGDA